jgi:putative lipoic acid-binding regulatory protein
MSHSDPYERLRALLSQETFPHEYIHKLIGNNVPTFHASLRELEREFPKLRREGERQSATGKHLAVTFVLSADSVDDVIRLVERSQKIEGLVVQL